MLPFAAVLAIVGARPDPGRSSRAVSTSRCPARSRLVVVHQSRTRPYGRQRQAPASSAHGARRRARWPGWSTAFLIGRLGLNPIVATLGTNALLYAGVLGISAGSPRRTTNLLASIAGGDDPRRPERGLFALAAVAITTVAVKSTVVGRRFEAVGANASRGRATGLKVDAAPRRRLRLGPGPLLARRRAARRHHRSSRPPTRATPTCCLGGRRRARRYLAARRTGNLVATAVGRAVPHPARTVRAGSGRRLRRPDPGPGGGARDRRRAVQRQLGRAVANDVDLVRRPRDPSAADK